MALIRLATKRVVAAITGFVLSGSQQHFGAKVCGRYIIIILSELLPKVQSKKCYKHVAIELQFNHQIEFNHAKGIPNALLAWSFSSLQIAALSGIWWLDNYYTTILSKVMRHRVKILWFWKGSDKQSCKPEQPPYIHTCIITWILVIFMLWPWQ